MPRVTRAPLLSRFAMLCAGLALLLGVALANDFDHHVGVASASDAAIEFEGSGSEPGASDELEESSASQSSRRQRPRENERAVRSPFVAPQTRIVDPIPQLLPTRRVVEVRTGRDLLTRHRRLLI